MARLIAESVELGARLLGLSPAHNARPDTRLAMAKLARPQQKTERAAQILLLL